MNWNWKEYNQQKNLFRSYYCSSCHQSKPCGVLGTGDKCCPCYFQSKKEQAQEYSNYHQVYQQEVKKQQDDFQQLQLLKSYSGCPQCRSKAVDAYLLYEERKLVCSPCLEEKNRISELERRKKKGLSLYPLEYAGSNPVSFSEKVKFYKKYWGINLTEWLVGLRSRLPVNEKCAKEWAKDSRHLTNCKCLKKEVQELVDLFTNSLRECQEKLKGCKCEKSPKVRVSYYDFANYGYTYCEKCEGRIEGAGKHGTIKNRNDPRFWGLEVEEKVLCGECLESKKGKMPPLRKAEFNRYRKTRRL